MEQLKTAQKETKEVKDKNSDLKKKLRSYRNKHKESYFATEWDKAQKLPKKQKQKKMDELLKEYDADISKTQLLVHRTEAERADIGSETHQELSYISVCKEYGLDWKEEKSGDMLQTLIDLGELSKARKIDKKQRQKASEMKLHEASHYMYMKVTKTTTRSTTSRESESFSHKQNFGLLTDDKAQPLRQHYFGRFSDNALNALCKRGRNDAAAASEAEASV